MITSAFTPLWIVSSIPLTLLSSRERKGSLKASLGNVSRAKLLQAILERGSEVCNSGSVLDSEVQVWNGMHAEIVELVSSS